MRKRVITIVIMTAFVLLAAVPAFALTAGLPNPWPPKQPGLLESLRCSAKSTNNLCAVFTDLKGGIIQYCGTSGQANYTRYTCTGAGTLTCLPGDMHIKNADDPAVKCATLCGACSSGWGR